MINQEMKDNGYVCLNSTSCPGCPDKDDCVDYREFNPWAKKLNRLEGRKLCICHGGEIYTDSGLSLVIRGDKLIVEASRCQCGYIEEEIQINSCFMCGRIL